MLIGRAKALFRRVARSMRLNSRRIRSGRRTPIEVRNLDDLLQHAKQFVSPVLVIDASAAPLLSKGQSRLGAFNLA